MPPAVFTYVEFFPTLSIPTDDGAVEYLAGDRRVSTLRHSAQKLRHQRLEASLLVTGPGAGTRFPQVVRPDDLLIGDVRLWAGESRPQNPE